MYGLKGLPGFSEKNIVAKIESIPEWLENIGGNSEKHIISSALTYLANG